MKINCTSLQVNNNKKRKEENRGSCKLIIVNVDNSIIKEEKFNKNIRMNRMHI